MPDREKVIGGLAACTGETNDCAGHTCPYWDFDDSVVSHGCRIQMELDALELLKEQQHKIWELNEINEYLDDVKKDQEHQIDVLKEQFDKDIIVRCKDCKAWKQYDDMNLGKCVLYQEYNKMGEWFCNFGERKEGL